MLAQNFKTAAELGVNEAEMSALIRVLGMLEREELPHDPNCETERGDAFRMNGLWHGNECGTVGCIAGHVAAQVSKGTEYRFAQEFQDRNEQLADLCLPIESELSEITPSQAASALRNFLTLGEARWAEVLA
jgi:hypothetical protein